MRRAFLVLALALAACSRSAPDAPVEYAAPDGSFSARLPAGWRVDDSPGETRRAAFFGPPDGPKPFAELIGVYFHRTGARFAGPEGYGATLGPHPPPIEREVAGVRSREYRSERTLTDPRMGLARLAVRSIVVPTSAGFFLLEHSRPQAGPSSDAVFESFLASFKPAN